MRISFSAKSAASTPPAPERMVTRASRASYSSESRVRISRLSADFLIRPTELDHQLEVVDAALELGEAVELALEHREPTGDAGGVVLVVPEVRGGDLLAEVGDLGAHAVEVEHLADGLHRRPELLDLGVVVRSRHETQRYRRAGHAVSSAASLRRLPRAHLRPKTCAAYGVPSLLRRTAMPSSR
jgi:hypothetical protein